LTRSQNWLHGLKPILVVAFGVFAFAGCGAQEAASDLDSTDPATPLLVAMGGFTSCKTQLDGATGPRGMGMFQPFSEVLGEISARTGKAPDYVISCFTSAQPVRWISSRAPDALRETPLADHLAAIKALTTNDRPVFLIGHSHGGWLSLKTAIALVEERNIAGLFSLDPISRINCNPGRLAGCLEPPRDIPTADYEKVAAGTDLWRNFYQSQTFYLRSGPIDQADSNTRLRTSHQQLDVDPAVWQSVREATVDLL